MPTNKDAPASKYMLKVTGRRQTVSNTRPRRACTRCRRPLKGAKGHGFPTLDGRGVHCGSCRRPEASRHA